MNSYKKRQNRFCRLKHFNIFVVLSFKKEQLESHMDKVYENTILTDLKNDKRESFNQLFRYYYPKLIAYVSSMIEDDIAEDITQDVFLYVWENRKKLYLGKGFHSYLFQSAYTRCIDYMKRHQSFQKYSSYTFQEHMEQYRGLIKSDDEVIGELYNKDFYKRLFELLSKVPSQRQEVFMLAFINGMKVKEIAEMMSMSPRTVEDYIYHTVKYLRNHMSKKDFFLFLSVFQIY